VFNPAEDVFDLASADIGIEQPNRGLTVQGSVRSLQPRRRLLFGAQDRHGLARHTRESIQAIGFVRIQLPRLSAPGHRPSGDLEDVGSVVHGQSEPFTNGLERTVGEPLLDAGAKLD
jgi:hypothetical protein